MVAWHYAFSRLIILKKKNTKRAQESTVATEYNYCGLKQFLWLENLLFCGFLGQSCFMWFSRVKNCWGSTSLLVCWREMRVSNLLDLGCVCLCGFECGFKARLVDGCSWIFGYCWETSDLYSVKGLDIKCTPYQQCT